MTNPNTAPEPTSWEHRLRAIADDFHPDRDADAPLALQEMRSALLAFLEEAPYLTLAERDAANWKSIALANAQKLGAAAAQTGGEEYEKMRGGKPCVYWRDEALEQAAKIAEAYRADPWIARDIRAMKKGLAAQGEA